MNNSPLEKYECYAFKEYLDVKKLRFTHIANEGKFPVQYRMHLKKMGLSSGVPDFMVIVPGGLAFVEMKRVKGSVTKPEQVEWIEALNQIPGIEARICFGFCQAKDFIEELTSV